MKIASEKLAFYASLVIHRLFTAPAYRELTPNLTFAFAASIPSVSTILFVLSGPVRSSFRLTESPQVQPGDERDYNVTRLNFSCGATPREYLLRVHVFISLKPDAVVYLVPQRSALFVGGTDRTRLELCDQLGSKPTPLATSLRTDGAPCAHFQRENFFSHTT